MLREAGAAAAIFAIGAWMTGAIGGIGGYHRTVDRSPAEVAAALADLDIRRAPGAPGTDPTRSGGELPTFRVEAAPNRVDYIVMAHGEVATTMTAWLKPVDGGRRTEVTASVRRGPAPDDYVSPAFRSTGLTLGLFAMELEADLDRLVFPPGQWTAQCDAIMARFEGGQYAAGFGRGVPAHDNLIQAIGSTARTGMQLGQLDKELKAAHCPQGDGQFHEVRSQLTDDGSPPPTMAIPPTDTAATTRPTVDLGKYR